ncbi:MAG: hypothetical protein KH106_10445 [Lactococcus lactis]|nr:hypothetical protein [Lactococcus lactis]
MKNSKIVTLGAIALIVATTAAPVGAATVNQAKQGDNVNGVAVIESNGHKAILDNEEEIVKDGVNWYEDGKEVNYATADTTQAHIDSSQADKEAAIQAQAKSEVEHAAQVAAADEQKQAIMDEQATEHTAAQKAAEQATQVQKAVQAAEDQKQNIVAEQAAEKVAAKKAGEQAAQNIAKDEAAKVDNGYLSTVVIDGVSHYKTVETYTEALDFIKDLTVQNPNSSITSNISRSYGEPKITNGYVSTVVIDGVSQSKTVQTYTEALNYIKELTAQNPNSSITSNISRTDDTPQKQVESAPQNMHKYNLFATDPVEGADKQRDTDVSSQDKASHLDIPTDDRKTVTKLEELDKKDSAKTTETTNKVAGKEAVKVNPIVSSGTVSIHSAQPESATAVKATVTGTKATTTSVTKSANQNEVKTLAASLPTTGDDAGLSLSLTFIGMILFGAVGVILALFQKHGRHSK